jgi:hypothetical protein
VARCACRSSHAKTEPKNEAARSASWTRTRTWERITILTVSLTVQVVVSGAQAMSKRLGWLTTVDQTAQRVSV